MSRRSRRTRARLLNASSVDRSRCARDSPGSGRCLPSFILHERSAQISRELLEERVGLLLDDGLTELADAAEDGEVGLDAQARAALARREGEAHARADPAAHPTVVGLGPHASSPPGSILLLDGHGALERKTDRTNLDSQATFVGARVDGLDGLDPRDAARHLRDLHQEIPQTLSLNGDHALLREGHRVPRADARAASHACVSARPAMTAAISR